MNIYDTLTARYNNGIEPDEAITAEIGLRQESGLTVNQVGEISLEALDRYVKRRIEARSAALTGAMITAAGRYYWPFTSAQLAAAYPTQTTPQRENTAIIQSELAADAVAAGVLGDLFNRATSRGHEAYKAQRDYYIGDPDKPFDNGEAGRLLRDLKAMVSSAYQGDGDASNRSDLHTLQMVTPGGPGNEWVPLKDAEDCLREPWEGTR